MQEDCQCLRHSELYSKTLFTYFFSFLLLLHLFITKQNPQPLKVVLWHTTVLVSQEAEVVRPAAPVQDQSGAQT